MENWKGQLSEAKCLLSSADKDQMLMVNSSTMNLLVKSKKTPTKVTHTSSLGSQHKNSKRIVLLVTLSGYLGKHSATFGNVGKLSLTSGNIGKLFLTFSNNGKLVKGSLLLTVFIIST